MLLPAPLKPMEPINQAMPFDSDNYLFQIKWDGVRCLAYIYKNEVRLFNRKLNERTKQYPELITLLNTLPKGIVLDGEIITLGEDMKPNFRRVLKRDLAKSSTKISNLIHRVPVFYMIFDIVYFEGKSVIDKPLLERQKILAQILPENPLIKSVDSVHHNGINLFEIAERESLEGIVAKEMNSPYIIGEKTSYWQKIKVWQKLTGVIGGYSTKMGEIRSLLIGLYNEENKLFYYIGNASSGISHNQWKALQQYFESSAKDTKIPFINPPKKSKGEEYYWVNPEICIELEYMEWTEDFRMRNPKVIDFSEGNPRDCVFS
ncbi:MAG: hypothetical protein APF76_13970 [Desulfitibacter sp. BRH_c19]|nr:MAG: hypothetical protein APF76_13970 [Desulfitibacter sp. BRH_c19]